MAALRRWTHTASGEQMRNGGLASVDTHDEQMRNDGLASVDTHDEQMRNGGFAQ
jgi:hypothetical protein